VSGISSTDPKTLADVNYTKLAVLRRISWNGTFPPPVLYVHWRKQPSEPPSFLQNNSPISPFLELNRKLGCSLQRFYERVVKIFFGFQSIRVRLALYYFVLNEKPVSPAMVAAAPPSNIQTALSVGAPVKRREKSDPNESEALMPKMISTIPITSSTSETGVFIVFLFALSNPWKIGSQSQRYISKPWNFFIHFSNPWKAASDAGLVQVISHAL
jgi:hypothetical protein